jgi:phosphatidylinositol 4-kinase
MAQPIQTRHKLTRAEASAIRDRIMSEMLALEEARMERMQDNESDMLLQTFDSGSMKSAEDENIVRRELNKVDPSAVVFSESWSSKKVRVGGWFLECQTYSTTR